MTVRIGVDLMGGDLSPFVIWEVLLEVLRANDGRASLVAFASKEIKKKIASSGNLGLSIVEAENHVLMEDSPLSAIRKKASSMALGLDSLREGNIDAFVSAGNTAALVTLSRAKIPSLPSVPRPALVVRVPTLSGSAVILDVGASVSVKPEEMLGFARMGIAYSHCLGQSLSSRIGLLNIGSEERKGTEVHRRAFKRLREVYGTTFLGNIESGDVFSGKADVVVTDGFTGNVFLKTAEGVFDFLRHLLGDRLETVIRRQLDYTIYPGSMVCGLSKLVVKCHGKASQQALFNGISGAISLSFANICHHILAGLVSQS